MDSTSSNLIHLFDKQYLHNRHNILVFMLDGGTGEELFARGVPDDRKIWSATAIVHEQYHKVVKDVHTSYLHAGSNAITTNTYGLIPGVGFSTTEISKYCSVAGKLARDSVHEYVTGCDSKHQPTFVFGSLGPLVESYRPDKILKHDEGVSTYYTMIQALSPSVDAFIAETISSTDEAAQVIDALSNFNHRTEISLAIPLFISFTVNACGQLRSNESVSDMIHRIVSLLLSKKNVRVLGILFNCSEPEAITRALENINNDSSIVTLLQSNGIVLGAYANRLTPVPDNWTMADSDGPQPFRTDVDPVQYHNEFAQHWVNNLNVRIVGGCCGITPQHIQLLSSKFNTLTPKS